MAMKSVVASGLVLAGAEKVKLSYTDCGSAGTHAKITGLTPDTIDMPGKATIVGSGALDADQTGAHFQLKVKKGVLPLVSGKGNICEDTTISLPLGAGSFTVKGLDCPAKAGDVSVEVDLDILSSLFDDGENSLVSIHIEATADDTGDQVICLDVDASLAAEEPVEVTDGSLALTWSDCGDSSTHGKTTDVQPTSLDLGAETAITGTGSLDKTVSGGTYDMELKAGGGLIDSHFTGNNCEAKSFNLPLGLGSLSWDGISCPLSTGDVSIGFHTELAAALPPALATSTIALRAKDQDNEDLLCVNLNLAKQSAFMI